MVEAAGAQRAGRAVQAALLVTLLLLGACATAIPPVEVTRFHQQPIAGSGRVAIQPADPRDADSLEFRSHANAVAAALRRVGFTVLDEGASGGDFIARVEAARQTRMPATARRGPVSVGVAGSTGSYGSSMGVGIGIDLSGAPKPTVLMQLKVQLRRAGDGVTIWEGRAETYAQEGTPAAQPGLAAGKLADSLFRDFPGQSGTTITVK
jgi:hypothetical protein